MNANHRAWALIAAALSSLVLSGCETYSHATKTEGDVSGRAAMIEQRLSDPVRNAKPDSDIVQYLDQQYVSLKPVERASPNAGKTRRLGCQIVAVPSTQISFLEAAQIVSSQCKVPVRVTPDALDQISSNQRGGAGAGATSTLPAPGTPIVGPIGGPPPMFQAGSGQSRAEPLMLDVTYEGDGDGFLDMITARAGGLSWKLDANGGVRIYAMDTRTFSIATIATATNMQSNFQSGTTSTNGTSTTAGGSSSGTAGASGGAGGQGQSTTMQNTMISMNTNFWEDMGKALEPMVGKGNWSVSPSLNTVTVRGNVDALDAVKDYVDYQNKRLSKFVQFNVRVYSVTLNNSDGAGINWNAMYKTLSGKYGFKLNGTPYSAAASAVNAGFSVISGNWAGTDAVVSALNEQGRTHLERETALPTLNLQSVATQVGQQKGYVPSTQTNSTANVGTTTSIQTGTINVGFNVSLFPYVQDNNEIMVQFNINLSSLDEIRKINIGDSSAEAPNISMPLNTVQKVKMRPGETLMLTGINQNDDSSTRTGTGTHWNWVLGGGINAQSNRTMLVVLITPTLLD